MSTQELELDERRGSTSASNAEADLLCPGRHLAQRGLPRPAESEDAKFGRRIHAALAWRKPEGLSIEERSVYEACLAIEVKAVREFFGPEADLTKLRMWPETRLWIQFEAALPQGNGQTITVRLEHSAKPDKVYRLGNRLLIPEYKTLAGDVPESPRNLQLRDQAVLARGHYLADSAGVLVIQPLVTHESQVCLYSSADLDRARDDLFARVLLSNTPGSPRVAGDAQCKFCLARNTARCTEHQKWAGGMVIQMSSLLDIPVSNWTPEHRRIFCDRLPMAQKWLDETKEAMAEGAATQPGFVPGYVMVPGAKKESITDPQKVFERFVAAGGNNEQFLKTVTITKTRLKGELAGLTGKVGRELDGALSELIAGATVTKQNRPSLKKEEQ